jgi:cell division protein FtsW
MKRFDLLLLGVVIVLTLFGLLMLFEASSFIAFRDFHDKYYYLREQSVWLLLGLFCLGFFSFFDYHKLYYLALPILIAAIVMLLLVFVPGIGVYVLGARRWINVGFSVLQPAEFVKLGLAVYLAAWFSTKEKKRFLAFSLLVGFVLLLVMLEPDMGTASVILAEALVVYFISGGSLLHFIFVLPVLAVVGFILVKLEPYRAARLATFLNFNQSLESSSYHVRQILIALGMGGIGGVGLGNSLQKYAYLPENATDSIFAIIAEEFGFIGGMLLIGLYAMLIWRGFVIASRAKDAFGKLLASGIITYLGVQAIINLGAQTALIPLTGIPLPFISYGGSALVVSLCAIGILLNISKQGMYTHEKGF